MATKIDPDTWYSVEETAEMVACSPKTLENSRRAGGGIPYSRLGRRIFYRGADIEAHLSRHRQRSTSDRPQPMPSAA